MDDKTRKYIAICMTAILIGVICIGMIAAVKTIQEKDAAAEKAKTALDIDAQNEMLRHSYDEAAKDYFGATAYFPGNILGKLLGYPQDKWPILKDNQVYTWTPLPGSWTPLPSSYPYQP